MLQFVLGISGTGKTSFVLSQIKMRAMEGQKSIFIVPEQFSSSAETMAFTTLGDRLSSFVEVYSFTSFAEAVLSAFGGIAVKTLTDAARNVAVRRALDQLGDEVPAYRKHRRSTNFCALCSDAIQELKTAGAKPEDLLTIAQKSADGQKLKELGFIFAAYEKVIEGGTMDPADRINTAAQRMEEGFLADTAVFLDNFDGFTAPQYNMLERLIAAQECTVALCCDELTDYDAGMGLFSSVKKAAQTLKRIAQRNQVLVATPKILEEDFRHRQAPGLAGINALLAYGTTPETKNTGFYCTPAANPYEECKKVACRIVSLVHENDIAYGDIAVICRTLDEYDAVLRYEFALADIPYFTDVSDTMEHSALTGFLTAALTLLSRGFSTEPLLRLLKTDLCGLQLEETALLENYAYTWQLNAAAWHEPFVKNPSGFGAEMTKTDREQLETVETLRGSLVPKVDAFLQAARGGSAAKISKELYLLLESFGASETVKELAKTLSEEGKETQAEQLYRTWDEMMNLLGQMEQLLGEDTITAAEYAELFALLIRSTDMGHVPETQDTVMLTTADRMRLADVKVCFVLGVNEGQFPKMLGASGLLTHTDRDLLVQHGVQMPGSYENRTLLEQMFFYRALTAPAHLLYVSYLEKGALASSALLPLQTVLSPPEDVLTQSQFTPTVQAALDLYGAHYREDTEENAALAAVLQECEPMQAPLKAMESAAQRPDFTVTDQETLTQLLGENLRISPTRMEQYYHCHFSYYLQYVLGLRTRKKAQLDPLSSGTLVHYILEHAFRRAGDTFETLTKQQLTTLASDIADEYIALNMPESSVRFGYLIARIKAGVARLLLYLQQEQQQSEFVPVAFEQEIGEDETAVQPITVTTPDGHTVRVVGKIDRVDVMQREGKNYLRVVDYKTGSKDFSLDSVYCGLNTQMLLYLFTLCRNGGELFQNPSAAGALYVLSDPSPKAMSREKAQNAPLYKVDGLVLNDAVVLHGMDKHATGLFVPVTFLKNGNPKASDKLAELETLGNIETHIESLIAEMANGLYQGEFEAMPLTSGKEKPCQYCEYRTVCRHEDGQYERTLCAPKDAFKTKEKEVQA